MEDRIRQCVPRYSCTEGPEPGHGRIETRKYNVYDGPGLIADKNKWGDNLTVVEFISHCTKESTGAETTETRLYVSNLPDDTPWIGMAVRNHWAIESMHRGLDFNRNIVLNKFRGQYCVETQIWTAMTTMLILAWLKHIARYKWALANLVVSLRLNTFTKIDLQKWLDEPFTPSPQPIENTWEGLTVPSFLLCLTA